MYLYQKKGTDEMIGVECPNEVMADMINILKNNFGGEWQFADFMREGDYIFFTGVIKNLINDERKYEFCTDTFIVIDRDKKKKK